MPLSMHRVHRQWVYRALLSQEDHGYNGVNNCVCNWLKYLVSFTDYLVLANSCELYLFSRKYLIAPVGGCPYVPGQKQR